MMRSFHIRSHGKKSFQGKRIGKEGPLQGKEKIGRDQHQKKKKAKAEKEPADQNLFSAYSTKKLLELYKPVAP